MKVCFKQVACDGQPQPLENFYKQPGMVDGHLNKCKACTKFDVEERRKRLEATNPEWVRKEKIRHRAKAMRQYFKERDTNEYKERKKRTIAAYAMRNPEKKKAVNMANNALRDGRIEREYECRRCGALDVRLEKHHADYSKPLDVEWLCKKCHLVETYKEAA